MSSYLIALPEAFTAASADTRPVVEAAAAALA